VHTYRQAGERLYINTGGDGIRRRGRAAESRFGLRRKYILASPAWADRLKIFKLHQKDWLSVAE